MQDISFQSKMGCRDTQREATQRGRRGRREPVGRNVMWRGTVRSRSPVYIGMPGESNVSTETAGGCVWEQSGTVDLCLGAEIFVER